MTFGLQIEEDVAVAIMDKAAEAGVTLIETADIYPLGADFETVGVTEEIVGRWLKGKRDDFIVATKAAGPMGSLPWNAGSSRRHLVDAVDQSLKRLGADWIDLFQLHYYDPDTPIDETIQTLDDLVRSGKVRYIGCSNFMAYQLARAVGRSEALRLTRFESAQPRYNLLFREAERELLPLCLEEQIAVLPYNPLAAGSLSGKHNRNQPPEEGSRFTLPTVGKLYQDRYWHKELFDVVEQFLKLSEEAGLKPATLAVAWLLAQPAISSPIIGATRPDQLDDTLAAIEADPDEELLAKLDELTLKFR